jgi:hypothetical protein
MNGRDERRLKTSSEGDWKPVQMAVDKVEFARTLERVRHVQRLPDPAIHRGILGVTRGANAVEDGGRH